SVVASMVNNHCCLAGTNALTDGKTCTQAFGHGDDIRGNSSLFKGKERSGTPHPGLDFIHHHQNPVLIAQCADVLEELLRGWDNAGFTLDGLEENSRSVG